MSSQKDWEEYFKLTNGRAPSVSDYEAAIQSGEITPTPQESAPVNPAAQIAQQQQQMNYTQPNRYFDKELFIDPAITGLLVVSLFLLIPAGGITMLFTALAWFCIVILFMVPTTNFYCRIVGVVGAGLSTFASILYLILGSSSTQKTSLSYGGYSIPLDSSIQTSATIPATIALVLALASLGLFVWRLIRA